MGQKTNPNILRLGLNKNWESEFFEKTKKELSLFIFNDLEIQNFVERFLKTRGISVYEIRQFYNNQTLNFYISYFISSKINFKKLKLISKSKNSDQKLVLKKSNGEKKIINYTSNDCFNYLIKVIRKFTKHKFDIVINFSCINKDFKHFSLFKKQKIRMLQKFKHSSFFNEGLELLFHISFNKNSAKLLSEFIGSQLKKEKRKINFFFVFLKQTLKLLISSNKSSLKGVKILLKGRLRKNLRATHKILIIGKVPVQTFNSNINYYQNTIHNNNGSYGIKVWIAEK